MDTKINSTTSFSNVYRCDDGTTNYHLPMVNMELPPDEVVLSNHKSKAPKTWKDKIANLIDDMTALRPSRLTCPKYGVKEMRVYYRDHHNSNDHIKYIEFPIGTKVKTESGVAEIQENEIAVIKDNTFNIVNKNEFLTCESIGQDTGSVAGYLQNIKDYSLEKQKEYQDKIDSELEQAGIKYIGREKDSNSFSIEKVAVEINGVKKEFDIDFYTKNDYVYKKGILELLNNGSINDATKLEV